MAVTFTTFGFGNPFRQYSPPGYDSLYNWLQIRDAKEQYILSILDLKNELKEDIYGVGLLRSTRRRSSESSLEISTDEISKLKSVRLEYVRQITQRIPNHVL